MESMDAQVVMVQLELMELMELMEPTVVMVLKV